jgi:transketolase
MDALVELYFREMNIAPENKDSDDRDRFVLSKGHCSPALYSVLAMRGYFPIEDLKLFRSIEGHYSGHPDMRHVAGVDMSTGSLGQGLSAAVGMALAGKLKNKGYRVYVICGDGEIDEGQIWEAMMSAAKYKLDNLCLMIDVNGLQIDGPTTSVMPTEPLKDKVEAFNWHVERINGHDFEELTVAHENARNTKGCPSCIIMDTVKGKGVSYMENNYAWHGKVPNEELYNEAIKELDKKINALGGA